MNRPACPQIAIPATLEAALDPRWLGAALAVDLGGMAVSRVETVEVLRTMATKVRFAVEIEGDEARRHYCLKAFLDVDETTMRAGPTMLREADFYISIAPALDLEVPDCVSAVVDRAKPNAAIIMRDLVADGARFCSAREAFSADEAAQSLAQLARLHQGSGVLADSQWITRRVQELAKAQYVPVPMLQQLLDGRRGDPLPAAVRNAERLVAGLEALAERDAARPQFLVHGDCHAGNNYRGSNGAGLIDWQLLQSGGWALDIAYHVAAVLPVEVAEREERRLLGEYLGRMRGAGFTMPGDDEAWQQYREAMAYGYYLWSITQRVEPDIIESFVERLGLAVTRHKSFELLGV